MAFINGFVTDRRDLTDDMYEDAAQTTLKVTGK